METVRLSGLYCLNEEGHSSKGNQLKGREREYWYKADYMGYEGLSEYLVSRLLEWSNQCDFVRYDMVMMESNGRSYCGCRSKNFLKKEENLITLEHLYRQYTGQSLVRKLAGFYEVTDKISWLAEAVENITGLKGFGKYLTTLLEIDTFFLNEDRHMNNIAVVYNKMHDQYRLCEYFDHGLALLADTVQDFPLKKTVEECMETVEAKPFSRSFDEQLDAAEALYGQQLFFHFDIKRVLAELKECREYYDEEICSRVEKILRYQMRKYGYLFKMC